MPLFKSSGFTPFLAGQMGETVHVSSILALGAAFVTTHQGIFFIAVFDFILICRETAQKWANLGVWGPKSKSKVQKTAKNGIFAQFHPITPNYSPPTPGKNGTNKQYFLVPSPPQAEDIPFRAYHRTWHLVCLPKTKSVVYVVLKEGKIKFDTKSGWVGHNLLQI